MSHTRFNQIFFVLMLLSAVSAFALPSRLAGNTPQISALFAPVARPAGGIARWAQERIAPEPVRDERSSEAIRLENMELKATVENLSTLLNDLRERDIERGKLGKLKDLCTPWSAIGDDSGTRETLALRGTSMEGLRDQMYVLYAGGVVGQIDRAGPGGSRVRLLTDPGFRVRGAFGAFGRRAQDDAIKFGNLETPVGLVEGIGHNTMVVRNLTLESVKKANLGEGDWVTLADRDWPPNLQGLPLGRITQVSPRTGAPLYAEIRIEPQTNLIRMREVMVVTRDH